MKRCVTCFLMGKTEEMDPSDLADDEHPCEDKAHGQNMMTREARKIDPLDLTGLTS